MTVVLCISFLYTSAQNYSYQEYGLREGLSGLTVYSIAQDHDGFLWIGTETGLSRFDGSHFKTFTTSDGLPDNEIIKIFVDSDNRIWLLPFANTLCYFENGVLHTSKNDSLLDKVKLKNIPFGICEDSHKNIAVYYDKGLNIISLSTNKVFEYENIAGYGTNISGIGPDSSGKFLLSLKYVDGKPEDIFFQYDNGKFKSTNYIIRESKNTRSSMILNSHYRVYLKDNNILINDLKNNTQSLSNIPPKFLRVGHLTDTSFSIISIDTIYLYSTHKQSSPFKFYIGENVNTIFSDRNGVYWIGTVGHGLYKIASLSALNYDFSIGKNELAAYSIFKQGRSLYAGTESACVWEIDLSTNHIVSVNNLNNFFDDPIKYNERIYFIKKCNSSSYFIGAGKGLFNFESITNLKKPKSILLNTQGAKFIYTYQKYALIANVASVYKTDIQLQQTKNGLLPKSTDTIWKGRSTCAIFSNNKYYIGTLNGLYTVNEQKQNESLGSKYELLSAKIKGIIEGSDGILWIATYGKGIIGLKNEKVVKNITEKDGLASDMCRAIEISNNKLWVGTDKGISSIDLNLDKNNINTYSSRDGLACNIINCLYIDNDTIYAGTPFGLSTFIPSEISSKSNCSIRITSVFSKNDSAVYPRYPLNLKAGDNLLHIEYNGISLKDDGDITYYYRMKGLQDEWQRTKENVLEYPSLNPGDYTFEIYAINSFDKKSIIAKLPVHIDSKFYQEPLFIVLSILGIAAIIWVSVAKYISRIKKNALLKQNMLRKMNELEQTALKSQMNPHFIFNCLNSIQQFIFEKDPRESNRFITNFASLIRQTLDLSDKKMISIEEEIKYLDTYLKIEQARFEDKFEYSVFAEEDVDTIGSLLPPLLLQPFIENSIRHGIRNLVGKKGIIQVKFAKENAFLICTIEDNGIGRQAAAKLKNEHAAEYQSKGMKLVSQRIEGLNEDNDQKIEMTIIDKPDVQNETGTIVIIKIPEEIYNEQEYD